MQLFHGAVWKLGWAFSVPQDYASGLMHLIWLPHMCVWKCSKFKNIYLQFRSSCSQVFFKLGVLQNFANFTGKYLCWNYFLINLQVFKPKKVFSYKICEIFKNVFLTEHLRWLLLNNGNKIMLNALSADDEIYRKLLPVVVPFGRRIQMLTGNKFSHRQ